jgi:hypothetical protein
LVAAILAYHAAKRGTSVPSAFVKTSNPSLIALNERVLMRHSLAPELGRLRLCADL